MRLSSSRPLSRVDIAGSSLVLFGACDERAHEHSRPDGNRGLMMQRKLTSGGAAVQHKKDED